MRRVLQILTMLVMLVHCVSGADGARSLLSCIQEVAVPVRNDMSQSSFQGRARHTLVVDVVLDKQANADLAPEWKAPEKLSLPMTFLLQFVIGQAYRKECAGLRFQVSMSILLVDRHSGRQSARIKDDNSIELVYHDNGSK